MILLSYTMATIAVLAYLIVFILMITKKQIFSNNQKKEGNKHGSMAKRNRRRKWKKNSLRHSIEAIDGSYCYAD